jgi:acyl dehydratase
MSVGGLAFGLSDIARWADFSGDYNAIHFDRASALKAGLEGLVVHGMLVLLTVRCRTMCAARWR